MNKEDFPLKRDLTVGELKSENGKKLEAEGRRIYKELGGRGRLTKEQSLWS